jgi:NAD(P)-dependent dehydrogenase (short-subunit alcohol dehydrogenase family)
VFDLNRFSLAGRTAIVTGGSRGIGKAVAESFAKAGARVVITSRKVSELEATAAEIKAFGGEAFAVPAHLGKMDEIQKMVDAAKEKLGGRIDILVNNAASSPSVASVLDSDERLWDTIMNLNIRGMYFISQAVARIMKTQGKGKIINIASIDGLKPEHGVSVYAVSKAGVFMITKAFASELAPYNIQVNTIAPGPFDTKMLNSRWFGLPPDEAKKQRQSFEKMLPLGHIGNPDEIAGAAIYLASDASSYTTGAEIVVDGGVRLTNLDASQG